MYKAAAGDTRKCTVMQQLPPQQGSLSQRALAVVGDTQCAVTVARSREDIFHISSALLLLLCPATLALASAPAARPSVAPRPRRRVVRLASSCVCNARLRQVLHGDIHRPVYWLHAYAVQRLAGDVQTQVCKSFLHSEAIALLLHVNGMCRLRCLQAYHTAPVSRRHLYRADHYTRARIDTIKSKTPLHRPMQLHTARLRRPAQHGSSHQILQPTRVRRYVLFVIGEPGMDAIRLAGRWGLGLLSQAARPHGGRFLAHHARACWWRRRTVRRCDSQAKSLSPRRTPGCPHDVTVWALGTAAQRTGESCSQMRRLHAVCYRLSMPVRMHAAGALRLLGGRVASALNVPCCNMLIDVIVEAGLIVVDIEAARSQLCHLSRNWLQRQRAALDWPGPSWRSMRGRAVANTRWECKVTVREDRGNPAFRAAALLCGRGADVRTTIPAVRAGILPFSVGARPLRGWPGRLVRVRNGGQDAQAQVWQIRAWLECLHTGSCQQLTGGPAAGVQMVPRERTLNTGTQGIVLERTHAMRPAYHATCMGRTRSSQYASCGMTRCRWTPPRGAASHMHSATAALSVCDREYAF